MRVVYLGISGVLHPSASLYELLYGESPWNQGHKKYEAVPWLTSALSQWPDVRLILTSTQPWRYGLPAVRANLGNLADRLLSFTYEDLTTKEMRQVRSPTGGTRRLGYSNEDYWRMNKSDIVTAHVQWLRPTAWVAADDEDISWPTATVDHVCIVDGSEGLIHPMQQRRLMTYLQRNFG